MLLRSLLSVWATLLRHCFCCFFWLIAPQSFSLMTISVNLNSRYYNKCAFILIINIKLPVLISITMPEETNRPLIRTFYVRDHRWTMEWMKKNREKIAHHFAYSIAIEVIYSRCQGNGTNGYCVVVHGNATLKQVTLIIEKKERTNEHHELNANIDHFPLCTIQIESRHIHRIALFLSLSLSVTLHPEFVRFHRL